MYHVRPSHQTAGEEIVLIRRQGLLNAVRSHHDGPGKMRELLMLVLPRRTIMPVKVSIFLKAGITMGREHFTVSIDVDSFALALLQDGLEILEVVTRYENSLPLLCTERDFGRRRVS